MLRDIKPVRMLLNGYSILPMDIQSHLLLIEESGMGFQEVCFEMKDGSFLTVIVENGAYVKGIDVYNIKGIKC